MNRRARRLPLCAAVTLVVAAAAVDIVAARGGRGGGGLGRAGGFNRGGAAARGSFGQERFERDFDRGDYYDRGPAADGDFDLEYHDMQGREERQERRQERRDEREERREDWEDYVEDDYGGDVYYDDTYGDAEVYWELPCEPNLIALGGVVYYVCDSTWYVRAYSEGDVVYEVVPPPVGNQ